MALITQRRQKYYRNGAIIFNGKVIEMRFAIGNLILMARKEKPGPILPQRHQLTSVLLCLVVGPAAFWLF